MSNVLTPAVQESKPVKTLSPTALAVWAKLFDHVDEIGYVSFSYQTLAYLAKTTLHDVGEARKELTACGVIDAKWRRGSCYSYRILEVPPITELLKGERRREPPRRHP